MAEYIKREDVINAAQNYMKCKMFKFPKQKQRFFRMMIDLQLEARNIPAADVRENVRGNWKYRHVNRSTAPITLKVKCDKCGAERDRLVGDVLNYCPNCGADMRGENE